MSQILVSYSDSDVQASKSAVSALQDAGLTVSGHSWSGGLESGGDATDSESQAGSYLVMLWSRAASQSNEVHQEVQRAIKAWSNSRLVLVRLDDAELPAGLRDLQALAPTSTAQALQWTELVERVKALLEQQARAYPESVPTRTTLAKQFVPTMAATILAFGSIGYAIYRRFWIGAHARDLGPAQNQYLYVFVFVAVGMGLGLAAAWAWSKWRRSQSTSAAVRTPSLAPDASCDTGIFISYSRLDTRTVEQLAKRMEKAGHAVWIDREAEGTQRYAASIVRAIKGAQIIALMSSRNAFASDHVIREVYVAGDYKKPFIVFQLDQTEFPDEVLYFISGFPRVSVGSLDQKHLQTELSKLLTPAEVRTSMGAAAP